MLLFSRKITAILAVLITCMLCFGTASAQNYTRMRLVGGNYFPPTQDAPIRTVTAPKGTPGWAPSSDEPNFIAVVDSLNPQRLPVCTVGQSGLYTVLKWANSVCPAMSFDFHTEVLDQGRYGCVMQVTGWGLARDPVNAAAPKNFSDAACRVLLSYYDVTPQVLSTDISTMVTGVGYDSFARKLTVTVKPGVSCNVALGNEPDNPLEHLQVEFVSAGTGAVLATGWYGETLNEYLLNETTVVVATATAASCSLSK